MTYFFDVIGRLNEKKEKIMKNIKKPIEKIQKM